jgi:hypothetical protein
MGMAVRVTPAIFGLNSDGLIIGCFVFFILF